MNTKIMGNRLLGGSSLIVISLVLAQPAQAQDITVSTSITTSQDFNATTAPGSNMTVTSDGTIITSTNNAITITGTLGSMLGTLLNSGLINNTASFPGRAIDVGTVSIDAIINSATGTISAVENGLFVGDGGTIGVLSNMGRIIGNSMAVLMDGSIGSLSNTGTISGSTNGVYVGGGGRIGTVNNAGVITAGSIGAFNVGAFANTGSITTFINTGTIISTQEALGNFAASASIGQVTNNGLISGETRGIWNQGTLSQITNTGQIVGGEKAIVMLEGVIGTFNNSGTISGGTFGISITSGSFGPFLNTGTLIAPTALHIASGVPAISITNAGVIAGNIDNLTAQALSISGGTLTGFAPGSQGTITSTLSNVVLGGNIALNSAINVGRNTVVSDGAALQLSNPVRVTGNYSQTGGTLLVGVTSTATYGQIQVSGSANLTGTNIRLVPLGSSTIAAGQAFTVVRANGTLTYSNLSASVADLDSNFSTVTSDGATGLVLSVKTPTPPAQFTATGIAAGPAAAGTGAALDAIINTGGEAAAPFITEVLLPLAILSPQEQERAISQLSPSQFSSQVISIATSPVVNAIDQRQETLADAGHSGETGMSAGSPDQGEAVWGQVLLNAGKRDASSGASAYVAQSYGLIVGADLISSSTLVAGGALSWVNSVADGRDELAGSQTRLNSYQATGYFAWKPNNPQIVGLTIDGQLGVGYNDFNQLRQIDFLGQRASAAFGGQQYLLNLRAGYAVPMGETASITPFVGLRKVHLRNSSYSESGAGAANLNVDKLVVDSMSHEIGLQGFAVFDTASGRFAPSLKIGWMHSYTNGLIPVNAELGGNAFTSTSTRGPHDGVSIGTGLTYMNSDRVRVGVQYDGELRKGFQNHSAMIKVRYNF